jgi:hypothetical protein
MKPQTESDHPLRAKLHETVAQETNGNFGLWAAKHGIPFVEVVAAAGYGGVISDAVCRALGCTAEGVGDLFGGAILTVV